MGATVALVIAAIAVGDVFLHGPPRGPLVTVPLTTPAPWAANGNGLHVRLAAVGLPALPSQGTVIHIHQHLDLFANGRRVTVPAGIGIDPRGGFFAPLHTHDSTGILHVESATRRSYTLGDFFGVWGVRLTRRCVGGFCAGGGKRLQVFSDGRRVRDPVHLSLTAHEEIVVAFGTPAQVPRPLPKSYTFPVGY